MRAEHLLFGYVEIGVRGKDAACFMNLCRELRWPYTPLPRYVGTSAGEHGYERENAFFCRMRGGIQKELFALCEQRGIVLWCERGGGLPCFLRRYAQRAGLWVGLLLGAVLLWLSGQLVWDVRIEPNEAVNMDTLREQLAACGLAEGRWIPTLDSDSIESELLLCSQDVAWVSVNMRGTVAYVQVRELLRPEGQTVDEPQNLVARCDGTVESVKLLAGQAAVRAGDVVRAGQLLISGVIDSTATGYRVTGASGEVMARTEHTLTVELPRIAEQKVVTEQKNGEILLFFFGKTIKVSKSTGIVEGNCDTIKRTKTVTLPGGHELPVSVQRTEICYYEMQSVTLDDDTLRKRAYAQLEREIAAATEHALLLGKQTECILSEDGIRLICTYRCVENIAAPQAFEYTDGGA